MIQHIETFLVDVPTIRPHKLSVATMNTQTLVLVRVRCADGIVGWGEATTIGGLNYGEESPDSIKVNIDSHIAPLLIGMDASRPRRRWRRSARSSRAIDSPSARSRRRCWTLRPAA